MSIAFQTRFAAAALAAGTFLAPLAARSQDVPSYAHPVYAGTDETIHGRIASVNGAFGISVNDDRGFIDNVVLHAGTIINPTGLALSPGMSVTIAGFNAGSTFNANEIDTPYTYGGAFPTPVYAGPGYWYPGFAYGYRPSFELAIIFGGGYRFEHRGYYGRPWDGHRYFGAFIGYEGGERYGDGGRYRGGERFGDGGRYHGGERYGDGGRSNFGDRAYATYGEHNDAHRFAGVRADAGSHVPVAFAGRTFAGQSYTSRAQTGTAFSGAYGSERASVYAGSRNAGEAGRSYAQPASRSMDRSAPTYGRGASATGEVRGTFGASRGGSTSAGRGVGGMRPGGGRGGYGARR